jgi:flagellum-specific ATP synthase
MKLNNIKNRINSLNLSDLFGTISKITSNDIEANGINVSIGDIIKIDSENSTQDNLQGIVVSVKEGSFVISPFGFTEGLMVGDKVFRKNSGLNILVGEELLGRVVNPLMEPIDDLGSLNCSTETQIIQPPIPALNRGMIDEVFSVGVKAIDGLLTCGKGQKVGIFAGSGVGKSTLLSMIVKGCNAKIKVVALIGERGREVQEFIHKNLNNDLTNTVLIVATSDDSPLMRKYGAMSAMSVAEYFKNKGDDVLVIMDSITRFAMAQREIGLALGEPPTTKGYPPSVLSLLPKLMERAGKEKNKGSITAFFTILVDGDDMTDPIADQSRSILDGHIVLDRELADFGIYPPIDIMSSISRLMSDIADEEHKAAALKIRQMYSLLKENEVLIRIGAYVKGTDRELDNAIDKKNQINDFLRQNVNELQDLQLTKNMMIQLVSQE